VTKDSVPDLSVARGRAARPRWPAFLVRHAG